jgi:4-hydroxyphenylacetaldehyde oxime monooxygenase
VNAWAIGRDPASWEDPEEFDPGRFERNKQDDVGFNGTHFELVPFGAGRRMCPGMALGVATTEFTLANLLYCFDWALPEGMAPEDVSMEEAGGLTVRKKTPLVLVPTRQDTHKSASSAS